MASADKADTIPTTPAPPLSSAADECFRTHRAVDRLRDACARSFADLSLAMDTDDKGKMAAAMAVAKQRLSDALRETAGVAP